MQPWRFVRVTDPDLRRQVHDLVEAERRRTADELGERQAEFLKLKVEGILDCGEVLVVALMDGRERYVFGGAPCRRWTWPPPRAPSRTSG